MGRNAKSRGNYSTGGWCVRRENCDNDNVKCDHCFQYSEFKLKEDKNERPKEPIRSIYSIRDNGIEQFGNDGRNH